MIDEPSDPVRRAEAQRIYAAWMRAERGGEQGGLEELCRDHPTLAGDLRELDEEIRRARELVEALDAAASGPAAAAPTVIPSLSPSTGAEGGSNSAADLVNRLSETRDAAERYRINGEIARGGQGAVLHVWDEDLRRDLAMKVVLGSGDAPNCLVENI